MSIDDDQTGGLDDTQEQIGGRGFADEQSAGRLRGMLGPRDRQRLIHGKGLVSTRGPRFGHPRLHSAGLVARFGPIKGVTPKRVLQSRLWLPAILNNIAITHAGLHSDYSTISAGQFSQPAGGGPNVETQLVTIPIDSLILAYNARWLVVTGQHPEHVSRKLVDIVDAREPVHLLVYWHPHHGERPVARMKCTVRQNTRTIQGGESDTEYVSLDVHKWRDPSIPVRGSHRRKGTSHSRKRGTVLPTTHKLKAGDTLHSLSHEFYGTFRFWRHIRDANGIPKKWGAKTPLVKLGRYKVGGKIKIPAPPGLQASGTVPSDAVGGRGG